MNKFPLQPGDRTQGQSGLLSENSTDADRRATSQDGLANPPGENAAPGHRDADNRAPLWKVGQVHPNPFLTAPYPVVNMQGDTSGTGTEIHEIDIYEYGDGYDPTAPVRSRDVSSEWLVDSDHDGSKN